MPKESLDLENFLTESNRNAEKERRHFLILDKKPKCKFCSKAIHKHHARDFSQKLCPKLSSAVDKRGSHTRSQNVSIARTAGSSSQIDAHNVIADDHHLHFFVPDGSNFRCARCDQFFKKSRLKVVLGQRSAAKNADQPYESAPRRRIHGKRAVSSLDLA